MAHDGDPRSPSAEPAHTPPHSLEAEQALIGAILFDNEVVHRISDYLKPDHFYDPVHQRLYETTTGLVQRGGLADAVTLAARMASDPGLGELGGPAYLAELLRLAAPAPSAPEYARLVYDFALRRQLIRLGEDIARNAGDGGADANAGAQIESAERALFSLAESGSSSSGFAPFKDALAQSITMAAAAYERDGGLSGIPTKLERLDYKLGGLHPSDLLILAGRPSMGKTALATNIAFNVARDYRDDVVDGVKKTVSGGVVAFFSLEMSSEQLATRLLADFSEVPSHKIRRGEITPEEYERIRDAAIELQSIPLYIDDTGGLSIAALAARARRLKRTVGLDLVVVDYLQLVTGSGQKRNDGRVQEVSEITQNLKALAKDLDVPVIALSQLSRKVEERDDKRPQLADLRESGSIEQDADVVMFVFREAYYLGRTEPREGTEDHLQWQDRMNEAYGKAEVIIGKQRHGPIGTVKLAFSEELTRFHNLDETESYAGYA
ncbi:MAG: replicative DNA helicase [Maricaulaceae bacterium]